MASTVGGKCPLGCHGRHNWDPPFYMQHVQALTYYLLVPKEASHYILYSKGNVFRYEMAWSPDNASPWCQLYSAANLRMMEFREDLAYYYLNGYANDINLKMTQPVFQDIFQRFEENEEGRSKYTAALHFAHETTVLPVLAALGQFVLWVW